MHSYSFQCIDCAFGFISVVRCWRLWHCSGLHQEILGSTHTNYKFFYIPLILLQQFICHQPLKKKVFRDDVTALRRLRAISVYKNTSVLILPMSKLYIWNISHKISNVIAHFFWQSVIIQRDWRAFFIGWKTAGLSRQLNTNVVEFGYFSVRQ